MVAAGFDLDGRYPLGRPRSVKPGSVGRSKTRCQTKWHCRCDDATNTLVRLGAVCAPDVSKFAPLCCVAAPEIRLPIIPLNGLTDVFHV
jgi:hypothetical protein